MPVVEVKRFLISDGRTFVDEDTAKEKQLECDVSRILSLNIEGISLSAHDRFIRNVIEKRKELVELLKEIK